MLEARHVRKRFGPVTALVDVSFQLRAGEVLGLIGDNGAGKSTLIKILTGFHEPDGGQILLDGKPVQFRSVADSRAAGIETVYQDLGLINDLPVYRNLFLKRERIRKFLDFAFLYDCRMKRESENFLGAMKVAIPSVLSQVGLLSGGQRQAIAVARALCLEPRILVLDEPLAAMGAKEGRIILDLVMELRRRRQASVILIVHNYAQVFEVCDRINWLSQGEVRLDKPVGDTSVEEITQMVITEYQLAR